MKRRDFITLSGGMAVWPLSARAQQSAMPVIGFLQEIDVSATPHLHAAFLQALAEAGYVKGKNLAIEYRFSQTRPELLPETAGDLVRNNVNVIFAAGPLAVAATRNATNSIPVVAVDLESDPLATGYIKSFARPGGNITGMFLDIPELSGKQLGLLKEIVPRLSRIAIFGIPGLNAPQFAAMEMQHGRLRSKLKLWKCGSRVTSRVPWRPPEHGTLELVSCCRPLSCPCLRSKSASLRFPNGSHSSPCSPNFQKPVA